MTKKKTPAIQKHDFAFIAPQSDKADKEMRKSNPYTPRVRAANEATSNSFDLFSRPDYKTGDGDIIAHIRPGSLHAFTLPSRGLSV